MKPQINILRIGPDAFTYRIGARGASGVEAGSAFRTIEYCLFDAGASLGHYFQQVDIHFEDGFLGSWATDALRRDPQSIAARIRRHACRPRACQPGVCHPA